MAAARHRLVYTLAPVLPVAAALGAAGALLASGTFTRVACGVIGALVLVVALWQRRLRPVVILDDEGYAIELDGVERVRVAWREVREARVALGESALYLDCGERGRNLLVPPARGWGFRFERADELCARVVASLPPEVVHLVERLVSDPPPDSASTASTASATPADAVLEDGPTGDGGDHGGGGRNGVNPDGAGPTGMPPRDPTARS